MVRIERLIIVLLRIALLRAWWKLYRGRVKRWLKQAKDYLPGHWRAKSPEDCPLCQIETLTARSVGPCELPVFYTVRKSPRGRKKQLDTNGFAYPNEACVYSAETDASRHAIVGHGKIGQDKIIQRLRCAACQTTFSCRKGTPLYYAKTEPALIAEVLWWLAEGVDISVLVRKFVYREETIAQWLNRAGEHGAELHARTFHDLNFDLIRYTPNKVWAIRNGLTRSETQAKNARVTHLAKLEFFGTLVAWCMRAEAFYGEFGITHTSAGGHPFRFL